MPKPKNEPYVRIMLSESMLKQKPVMKLVKALIREMGNVANPKGEQQ